MINFFSHINICINLFIFNLMYNGLIYYLIREKFIEKNFSEGNTDNNLKFSHQYGIYYLIIIHDIFN